MMRIKLYASAVILVALSQGLAAQILEPVKWSFNFQFLNETEGEVIATAIIDEGWHVYALQVSDDPNFMGPIETKLEVEKSSKYSLVGAPTQGKFIRHADPQFDNEELMYFENTAVFKQKIKLETDQPFNLKGVLQYMSCNDEKCVFPDPENFSLKIAPAATSEAAIDSTQINKGIKNPVRYSFRSIDKGNNQYELVITANLTANWHTYSIVPSEAGGPSPTEFSFRDSSSFQFIGGLSESATIKKYDALFMTDVQYFTDSAEFRQIIQPNAGVVVIQGSVKGMACNDDSCVPVQPIFFSINLKTGFGTEIEEDQLGSFNTGPAKFRYFIEGLDPKNPVTKDCGQVQTEPEKGDSLWQIFILGFLGGLLALLTPCVFPMIPLTVSFFTKGSQNRKKGVTRAIIYGSFIFGIYLLLSLPFHLLDSVDENILNNISTNVPLNTFFFIIFVVFAISFFGFFEITLPSSIANKADSASNTGGLIGSFFMALTLAIVSFSCTGPILGSLLASSLTKDGGAIQLTAGMGGFGAALGIPFAIFAAFPSMLSALPKSGGWLNSVKVVLGFLELALALKFLSNADLVGHWDFLKYELFMGLWIIIFALMVLYLFGKLKFPHDSPLKKLSLFRIGFAVLTLSWVIYLGTGFRLNKESGTYHSLTLLSGLAPPTGYSWIYPISCPHNLDCEHDYIAGLERAKRENKPIFLDFTGYACVNCRKMEENVWIDPEIIDKLRNEVIVVSLYVDDGKELPEELKEKYTSLVTGKTRNIKTYGDRWATFQIETFVNNSQPWYVMLSPDEKILTPGVGYTPNAAEYNAWLQCGLNTFKEMSNK
ncbi:MAG: protein-disulfide reductase DsbD family protein [Flavobacteriales bacterium]|nr:protein-disulfide reductase DsbD family protein [Flavobacteriales bacterium]